jgi:transcriptional regulator with XRE-family HTH domain
MARRRVTQERLAQALHLSQPAVSRRLKGEVDFTVSELAVVAELLDVDAAHLVTVAAGERAS